MNATKRKFNALLNSIGSRPPVSTPHNDVSPFKGDKLQTKKRRVSGLASEACHTSLNSRLNSPLLRKKPSGLLAGTTITATPTATPTSTPKYAPWDRTEFLKRLKSFSSISDWTPKPVRVNEVQWAKRGWVCQKSERVRCCLCNVEIIVKLNRKEVDGKEEPVYVAHAIEEALVDKYVDLIIQSHEASCLWRQRGCDESIFTLPLNHPPTTIMNFKERYEELRGSGDYLPYTHNLRTPPEVDPQNVLRQLPKDFFDTSASPDQVNALTEMDKVAFSMALFGWQGYKHERFGVQYHSASCHACFRVLGLWIFKSKEMSDSGEELLRATMNCLDVVGEHRAYCPWRNPASQSRTQDEQSSAEALPGWKIVMQTIKSEFILRNLHNPAVLSQLKADDIAGINAPVDPENEHEKDNELKTRLKRVRSLFDPKAVKRNLRSVRVRGTQSRDMG